ncbi:MAG: hypothetical protein RJA22_2685 [Verrucomicrobiota bacterium]|jgi:hypothetical protein
MKKLIYLLLLAGLGTAGALLVARQLDRQVERDAQVTRQRESFRWSQGYYVAVTNTAEARAGLLQRAALCDTNGLLEAPMRESLVESLLALCQAYSAGDFDAFVHFRLAAADERALEITSTQLQQRRDALPAAEAVEAAVRAGRRQGVDRPVTLDNPLGLLEAWWYAGAPRARDFNDASKPLYCQDCWKEIAPHDLGLIAEWRRTPPSSLLRIANRMAPMQSMMEVSPMLQPKPTLDDLLGQQQPVLFVHCLLPVRMDHEIKARPVLVSFYWSAANRKFLPHRMSLPAGDVGVYYIF